MTYFSELSSIGDPSEPRMNISQEMCTELDRRQWIDTLLQECQNQITLVFVNDSKK